MRLPSLSRIVGGLPWRYFFAAPIDGVEEIDWNDRLVSHHLPAWVNKRPNLATSRNVAVNPARAMAMPLRFTNVLSLGRIDFRRAFVSRVGKP